MRKRLVFAALVLVLGCDAMGKLRAFLKGDGESPFSPGLRVEVTPKDNLTISVDGTVIGHKSPLVTRKFGAGNHLLDVRSPGYYPVSLPIELKEGETLTVPVALRPGAPAVIEPPPGTPVPPEPPAPPLPAGVAAISLVVASGAEVLLDGAVVDPKRVKLERVSGTLETGNVKLGYRVGGQDILELTLTPGQAGAWQRDGMGILPGNSFRLHHGATRLVLTRPDGAIEAVILKR